MFVVLVLENDHEDVLQAGDAFEAGSGLGGDRRRDRCRQQCPDRRDETPSPAPHGDPFAAAVPKTEFVKVTTVAPQPPNNEWSSAKEITFGLRASKVRTVLRNCPVPFPWIIRT